MMLLLNGACVYVYSQVPVADMRLLAIQQPALLVVAPYTVRCVCVCSCVHVRVHVAVCLPSKDSKGRRSRMHLTPALPYSLLLLLALCYPRNS